MDTLRTFFAVELGDNARAEALRCIERLHAAPGGDRVRWVRPEALHVTLRFLGDVPADAVPVLAEQVGRQAAKLAPFELALGDLHAFPNARRPRVVALDLAPEQPLAELAAASERGVVAAGLEPERRRFRPHLTLGRLRGARCPDTDGQDVAPSPFRVDEVVLFRSELRPQGSLYTPLERVSLGGPESP